jgi:hypothetical protein
MNRYDIELNDSHGASDIIPSIIIIDSADRDNQTDPLNSYTITLNKPLRDVRSIKLVQCIIPDSNFNISSTKNKLHITADGTVPVDTSTAGDTITIPSGYYTIDNLLNVLQDLINDAFTSANVVVSFNAISRKVLITSDVQFALYFDGGIVDGKRTYRTGSIGDLLGFRPANYITLLPVPSLTTYEIESSYRYNLELDRYIILKIRGMSRYDSVNKNVQDAFCIVPLNIKTTTFSCAPNPNNEDSESFTYYPSKGTKITKFSIEFLDWNGNAYDFRGLNHFMAFEVISETHRRASAPARR